MTGELDRTVVQPAADDARDDASHRWIFVGMALMFGAFAVMAVLLFRTSADSSADRAELSRVSGIAQQAITTGNALTDQVKKLGGTPAAPVPAAASVPGAPGTPGAAGATGAVGPLGPKGDTGAVGPAPSTDFLFSLIKPLIPAPVPGVDGKDGVDGTNGQNGKDGTNGTNGQDAPKPGPGQFVPDNPTAPTTCTYRVTYSDGTVSDAPAPLAMCPPVVPFAPTRKAN